MRRMPLIAGLGLFAVLMSAAASAQSSTLSGTVSSAKEGLMEGVVVSAKKVGSTITTSVATDDKGRFSFPAGRLEPGQYALSIRAIGYDLENPRSADVTAGKSESVEIKLAPTRNLAKQMSNAEWFLSFPGTDQEKKALLNCVSCHNLDRIVRSQYDGEQFVDIFNRMVGYYPGSTPEHPQRLVGNAQRSLGQGPQLRTVAEYLASVNLSKETWSYPLKTLPRLTGRSNRFIVTEYALPRRLIQPHDVMLDEQGMIWFTHFAEQFFGKMDPKTGQVWEYPLPVLKPGYPVGTLDLGLDKDGNPWIGMMYQAGIARFDKKTETFKTWSIPKEWQTDAAQTGHLDPSFAHVDGKVWVKNSDRSQILRLDVASGEWENLGSFSDNGKRLGVYGIRADSNNNLYLLDFQTSTIGIIDAKTKKFTPYRGEIANSRPRRGVVDGRGPALVCAIRRQRDRHVRSQDREGQGMGRADALGAALRRRRRQERRSLDRLDDERPRIAARSEDRPVRGVSTAEDHQHPPRVRRQLDHAGDVLDRLQPRRVDHQARTARLDIFTGGAQKTQAPQCGA